ncbi:MAG: hypothetical protein AAF750_17215 [Planctomycetota bacterium]
MPEPLAIPDLPPGSALDLTPHDHGFTVRIPPAGVRAARLTHAIAALSTLLTLAFIIAGIYCIFIAPDLDIPLALFLAVTPVFALIAVGTGLYAVMEATEHGLIDLVDRTLVITRKNRFVTKQHEFTADQIRLIAGTSASQSRYNTDPATGKRTRSGTPCISVRPHHGRHQECFTHLAKADARHLADVLHERLVTASP